LSGPFAARAPAGIVAAEREKLTAAKEEVARLKSQLEAMR
jgi:hypothetical protein